MVISPHNLSDEVRAAVAQHMRLLELVGGHVVHRQDLVYPHN